MHIPLMAFKGGSSQKGNAIISVLMAAVVVSVAYYASLETIKNQAKQAITDQQQLEMIYYSKRVAGILSNSDDCIDNFPAGQIHPSDGTLAASEVKNSLRKNGSVAISPNEPLGNGVLQVPNVGGFQILDTTKDSPSHVIGANATNQKVSLVVGADKTSAPGSSFGSQRLTQKITLYVNTDAGGAISSCRADTGSEPITCMPLSSTQTTYSTTADSGSTSANCPTGYKLMSGGIELSQVEDDASIISRPDATPIIDPITKTEVSSYERWLCESSSNKGGYTATCSAICCKF